jgi:hypothetical protein
MAARSVLPTGIRPIARRVRVEQRHAVQPRDSSATVLDAHLELARALAKVLGRLEHYLSLELQIRPHNARVSPRVPRRRQRRFACVDACVAHITRVARQRGVHHRERRGRGRRRGVIEGPVQRVRASKGEEQREAAEAERRRRSRAHDGTVETAASGEGFDRARAGRELRATR